MVAKLYNNLTNDSSSTFNFFLLLRKHFLSFFLPLRKYECFNSWSSLIPLALTIGFYCQFTILFICSNPYLTFFVFFNYSISFWSVYGFSNFSSHSITFLLKVEFFYFNKDVIGTNMKRNFCLS